MNKDHNIGALVATPDAGVAFNSVAAGLNDNTEKVGVIIDREAHGLPLSMSLVAILKAVLGAGNTLSLGYRIEHGNDPALADTTNLVTLPCAGNVVLTGPVGGATLSTTVKADVDLGGAHRYIRVNVTTDLSAANTDTAVAAAAVVFGGGEWVPQV